MKLKVRNKKSGTVYTNDPRSDSRIVRVHFFSNHTRIETKEKITTCDGYFMADRHLVIYKDKPVKHQYMPWAENVFTPDEGEWIYEHQELLEGD
jgi:hypothetical protein